MSLSKPTGDAGAPREITPREIEMYKKEYQHGAELFQKAVQQHAKSSDLFQKEEFQDVMQNMMEVLRESARALKKEHLEAQNKKISDDLAAYQDSPSVTNREQLLSDLKHAQKSV
jgi:hypothetical protein